MVGQKILVDVDTVVLLVGHIDGIRMDIAYYLSGNLGAATRAAHKGSNDDDNGDDESFHESTESEWQYAIAMAEPFKALGIGGIWFHTVGAGKSFCVGVEILSSQSSHFS